MLSTKLDLAKLCRTIVATIESQTVWAARILPFHFPIMRRHSTECISGPIQCRPSAVKVYRAGRQHEISHQYGSGVWRFGFSVTLRQSHRTSTRDESGRAIGSMML